MEGSSRDAVRGELMGLEGTGGRMYWQQIGDMLPDELGFAGRQSSGRERCGECGAELRLWNSVHACVGRGDERGAGAVCRIPACGPERQAVAGAGSGGGVPAAGGGPRRF